MGWSTHFMDPIWAMSNGCNGWVQPSSFVNWIQVVNGNLSSATANDPSFQGQGIIALSPVILKAQLFWTVQCKLNAIGLIMVYYLRCSWGRGPACFGLHLTWSSGPRMDSDQNSSSVVKKKDFGPKFLYFIHVSCTDQTTNHPVHCMKFLTQLDPVIYGLGRPFYFRVDLPH